MQVGEAIQAVGVTPGPCVSMATVRQNNSRSEILWLDKAVLAHNTQHDRPRVGRDLRGDVGGNATSESPHSLYSQECKQQDPEMSFSREPKNQQKGMQRTADKRTWNSNLPALMPVYICTVRSSLNWAL